MLILGMMFLSGCQMGSSYPDLSVYIDETQENAPDNAELAAYMEELEPVLAGFYQEQQEHRLDSVAVKGNEIRLVVDLGGHSAPYGTMEERMLYEVSRLTHSILTFQKDLEALKDLYRITIRFEGEKTVVLYGAMTVDVEGTRQFRSRDILDAVKRP